MRSVKANTSFWDVIWISSSQIYIKILILKNFNKLDLMVRNSKAVIPSLKFQISSVAQSCPTLCDPMDCSTLGFPVHHQLLELTQTHVHGVGNAIQPSHPLLSPSPGTLQSFPASGSFPVSQFFASGGQSIGASASASVLPMNIQDWFPLGWTGLIFLQGTLKSLLQYQRSKASVFQHPAFLIIQLSHPYMTTGKTIALTRQTFVGK